MYVTVKNVGRRTGMKNSNNNNSNERTNKKRPDIYTYSRHGLATFARSRRLINAFVSQNFYSPHTSQMMIMIDK